MNPENEFLEERVFLAKRMAWVNRHKAVGQVLFPEVLYGFRATDGSSVEIRTPGQVIVMGVDEQEFMEDNVSLSFAGGQAIFDSYWDVMALGWTPVCPKTGALLVNCYILGPEIKLAKPAGPDGTPVLR